MDSWGRKSVIAEDWALDVCKYVPDADQAAIAGIVRHCGIALRSRDASLVSFSDSTETGRVRESFLKKKLALTDPDDVLDVAIARVGDIMKADPTKNRVTVYYLLADHFGKLGLFGGGAAPAPLPLMAVTAEPAPELATEPVAVPVVAAMAPTAAPPVARAAQRMPMGSSGYGDWAPFVLLGLGGLLVYGIISGGGGKAPAATMAAPAAAVMAVAPTIPTGAGIIESEIDGRPMVSVYFDTAKSDVDPDFASRTTPLRNWLAAHAGNHLQLSGFNDSRGNAEFNAALSKRRAFAVRDALAGLGVAATDMDLVKPADTTDGAATLAEARRVDVTIVDGPIAVAEVAAPPAP